MSQFKVYVSNDLRVPERDYDMGLETLYEADDIEVEFLTTQNHDVLRSEDLSGADALVAIQQHVTPETLDGLDHLQIVSAFGAGLDHIDIDDCTERGIAVVNAPQPVGRAVAQSTLGMLIACASNSLRLNNHIRERGFEGRISEMGHTLFGKTLGTIGLGMIGSNVVELVEPFDMEIITYDPYLSEARADELGVKLVGLDHLLETAEFISLHCPLTDETRGMIGTAEFKRMNEDAYLLNTTRGGLYDDRELAEAIKNGEIAGAAIDVFEDEPNVDGNPLLALDDCLMTPHMAGVLMETMTEQGELISDSIRHQFHNEVPGNLINPDVFEESVDESLLSPSHH